MTVPVQDITDLVFAPPGPGSWTLDPVHNPKPVTRYNADVIPDAMLEGFAESARRYGVLFNGMRMERVHGFTYGQRRPVPMDEIPARMEAAARVFETKLWRQDLEWWDTELKPAGLRRNRELLSVDTDALDEEELIAHLGECRDHHAAMVTQHHRMNFACLIPLGDFLVQAGGWTGLTPAQLSRLFVGASPVSAGDSPERQALVRALEGDPEARTIVEGDEDPASKLASLRARPGIGNLVEEWLLLVGHRLLDGFDVANPVGLEQPEFLIASLRTALTAEPVSADADLEAAHAQVPDEHRDAFDALYEEARITYRLRDERGVYCDVMAAGVMRRAMLAAGRRLYARRALASPEQAVDATIGELTALLRGEDGPSADELQARAGFRQRYTVADAPPLLGEEDGPPPPLDMLPPAARRVMEAGMTVLGHLFAASDAQHSERTVRGFGVGGGVHEGRARVVKTVDDIGRLEEGDVLVTITTGESFNVALAIVSAAVADAGGLMSHTAIMAREFGIPAVVGTRDGTARIPDGALVRVDGDAGEVTWS